MKFGGASIGTPDKIKRIASIVKANLSRKPVVVVSAFENVTNKLIEVAQNALMGEFDITSIIAQHHDICAELGVASTIIDDLFDELDRLLTGISLIKELTPRSLDYVQSFGEKASSRIIADYFAKIDVSAKAVNSFDLGLITDSNFTKAKPLADIEGTIKQNILKIPELAIVTGFIAKNIDGEITTLGRNGSDLTATLIGSAIDAEEIQIWRAIPGVMTADPRFVESAQPIAKLSFGEAAELAYYGTRILHPTALIPAMNKSIPVRSLYIFEPENPGTLIIKHRDADDNIVKSIAYRKKQIIVDVASTQMLMQSGYLGKIFDIFARNDVIIDVVATSEISVSITTDSLDGLNESIKELERFAEVKVHAEKALIAVVGEGMKETCGIAGKVFNIMSEAKVNIEMISFGASKLNLAFLVNDSDVGTAVRMLHEYFFNSK